MIALFSKPNIFPLYAGTQLAFSADYIQKAAQSSKNFSKTILKNWFTYGLTTKNRLGLCGNFSFDWKGQKKLAGT
jgi:hypothetical protein